MRNQEKFYGWYFTDGRLYSMFDSEANPAKNEVGNLRRVREKQMITGDSVLESVRGMPGRAHVESLLLDHWTRTVKGSKMNNFCGNCTWKFFSAPLNFICKIAR